MNIIISSNRIKKVKMWPYFELECNEIKKYVSAFFYVILNCNYICMIISTP